MSTFADVLREGMLSLPHDLKAVLRVVEDPDLDDAGRVLACGTILHVLSGQNARHCEDSAETIGAFDGQMKEVRAHLGELMVVLDRAVDALPKTNFEGRTATECARDPEAATWLYDSVQEAIVERLELDEDAVVRALKSAGEIRGFLKQRL